MPYCPSCSTRVQSADAFCLRCGTAVGGAGQSGSIQTLPFRISLTRVLTMTVLSYGTYLFYWFYLTWKQYRDHTRTQVFPVWHALTLIVPIYGLFRVHAHIRTFKELMVNARLRTTLNAGLAAALVAISSSLDWESVKLSWGEITQETAMATAILDILSLAIVAWLLLEVQGNLNRYWRSLANVRLTDARIGVGEVVFALLGILAWLDMFATLLSPAYRNW